MVLLYPLLIHIPNGHLFFDIDLLEFPGGLFQLPLLPKIGWKFRHELNEGYPAGHR